MVPCPGCRSWPRLRRHAARALKPPPEHPAQRARGRTAALQRRSPAQQRSSQLAGKARRHPLGGQARLCRRCAAPRRRQRPATCEHRSHAGPMRRQAPATLRPPASRPAWCSLLPSCTRQAWTPCARLSARGPEVACQRPLSRMPRSCMQRQSAAACRTSSHARPPPGAPARALLPRWAPCPSRRRRCLRRMRCRQHPRPSPRRLRRCRQWRGWRGRAGVRRPSGRLAGPASTR